jgi:hypothetical protein
MFWSDTFVAAILRDARQGGLLRMRILVAAKCEILMVRSAALAARLEP